jgi:energy-coupling factor transporter ATP-binding protein EcfA2
VSGGEGTRLALARALLHSRPGGLVLLDEPTAHLDEPTAHALRTTLRTELAGRTVVHVTHTAEEARAADIVYEVRDGRVIRTDVTGAADPGRRAPNGESDPAVPAKAAVHDSQRGAAGERGMGGDGAGALDGRGGVDEGRVVGRGASEVRDSRRGADGERGVGRDGDGAQVTEDAGVGW